jgi:3-oxoacyl-[acyl-carrier-protein] synthase-3
MFSRITGTGSFLPGQPVSNDELARRGIATSDEWITSRTGISFRHLAENGQTSSMLALEASRRALAAAGLQAADLDLIIVATSTPDFIFPSTACLLQGKLGNHGATTFDVQAVCSGFVYGLTIADKFIRSGSHRRALVVGAEVFSNILDWSDRATCVLFGDGAGAVVLEASDSPGILATALHADGAQHAILSVPGSICGGRVTGDPFPAHGWTGGIQVCRSRPRRSRRGVLCGGRHPAGERRLADSAPGQYPHSRSHGQADQDADGQGRGHRRSTWQYVGGVGPPGAR